MTRYRPIPRCTVHPPGAFTASSYSFHVSASPSPSSYSKFPPLYSTFLPPSSSSSAAAPPMAEPTTSPKPNPSTHNILMGRYELGRLLGQGTFAKVYSARSLSTGEHVAIKILDKDRVLKGGLAPHIKREISALRRVRHPHVVLLHEVMASKSKIYFVMELVRGGELFKRVSKGRLKEPSARLFFQQLLSAVSFCHSRGVYHRDLKPENLLLDHLGRLKVSDFGLSAIAISDDSLFHTFCGTPAYVAPEVLTRKGYDAAKADIWSCGVILFVLMAGYLPFHDHNLMAMYRKIYKGEFRCPRWFSPEFTRLVTRLLDTNPDTRITIPEIMEDRWFRKGFRQTKFYIEDDRFCFPEDDEANANDNCSSSGSESDCSVASEPPPRSLPRPASLNAFDIISFSRGFDLSGLFEDGAEGSRFVCGEPVAKIVAKLEEIAKVVSFTVRKKDCRVSLEGTKEGRKGPLTVAAEIFELTPSLVMVEVKKKGGDCEEYRSFCDNELNPMLRNLRYNSTENAATATAAAAAAAALDIASDTE